MALKASLIYEFLFIFQNIESVIILYFVVNPFNFFAKKLVVLLFNKFFLLRINLKNISTFCYFFILILSFSKNLSQSKNLVWRIIMTLKKRKWFIVMALYIFFLSETVTIIFSFFIGFLFLIEEAINFLLKMITSKSKAMRFFKVRSMLRICLFKWIHSLKLIILNFMSDIGLDLLGNRLKFFMDFFLPFLFLIF